MSFIIRLENLPLSATTADIRHFFDRIEIPDGGIYIIGGVRGIAFISLKNEYDMRLAFFQDGLTLHKNCIRLSPSDIVELEYIERLQKEDELMRGLHDNNSRQPHYSPERENRRISYREGARERSPERDVRRRSPYIDDRRKSPSRAIRRKSPERDHRRRSPKRNIRNSPESYGHRRSPDRIIRQKPPERHVTSKRRSQSPNRRSDDRHYPQNDFPHKTSPHTNQIEPFSVERFEPNIDMQNTKQNLEHDVKFATPVELHEKQLPERNIFINDSGVPVLSAKVDEYSELSKPTAISDNMKNQFQNLGSEHPVVKDFDNSLRDSARIQSAPFIDEFGYLPEPPRQEHGQSQILNEMVKLPDDKYFAENYAPDPYNSSSREYFPRFTDSRDKFIDPRQNDPNYYIKDRLERFQNPEVVSNNLERLYDFSERPLDNITRFGDFPKDEKNSRILFQDRRMDFKGFEYHDNIYQPLWKHVPNYCVILSGFTQVDDFKEVQQALKKVYAPKKNIKWEISEGSKTGTVFVKICNEDDFYDILRCPDLHLNKKRIQVTKCPDEVFWKLFPDAHLEFQSRPEDLILELKGLPYATTENEIMSFFKDLKFIDIVILYDKDRKATGSGFVEFDNIEDYRRALARNGKKIGHRYIELLQVTRQNVANAKKFAFAFNDSFKANQQKPFFESQTLLPPTNVRPLCALLSGLSPNISNSQIYEFFTKSDVQPHAIHILITNVQRPIGRAYAEFYNPFEFDIALMQHGKCIDDCTISVKQVLFEEMMNVLETNDALHLYANKTTTKRSSSPVPEKVPYLWDPPDETEESRYKSSKTTAPSSRSRFQATESSMAYNRNNENFSRYLEVSSQKRNVQVFDYAHRGNNEPVTDMNKTYEFTRPSVKDYERISDKRNQQKFDENERRLQNFKPEFRDRSARYSDNRDKNFKSHVDPFRNNAPAVSGGSKLPGINRDKKENSTKVNSNSKNNHYSNKSQRGNAPSSISSSFQQAKTEEKISAEVKKFVPENINARDKHTPRENNNKRKYERLSPTNKTEKEKQSESGDYNKRKKYEKTDSDKKDREASNKKLATSKPLDKSSETRSDKTDDSQQVSDKKKANDNQKNESKKNEPTKNKERKGTSHLRPVEKKHRSRSRERYQDKMVPVDPSAMFGKSRCIIQASDVHPQAGLAELLDFFRSYDLCSDDIIRRFTDSGLPTGDIRIAFRNSDEAKRAIRDLNYRKIRGVPIKMFMV